MKTTQSVYSLPVYSNEDMQYIVAVNYLQRSVACNNAIIGSLYLRTPEEILSMTDLEPTEDIYSVIVFAMETIEDKGELNKFLLALIPNQAKFIRDTFFHYGTSNVFSHFLSSDNRELLACDLPQWLITDIQNDNIGIYNFSLDKVFAYCIN